MDCRKAQEEILESLDQALCSSREHELDRHLSVCAACARFASVQHKLDRRLAEAICSPRLSPGFRAAVNTRISRQEQTLWPDWLPDVAYLAGSVVAIGFCAVALPFPLAATLSTGAGLAIASYSLQTELLSSWEEMEQSGQ